MPKPTKYAALAIVYVVDPTWFRELLNIGAEEALDRL